MTVTGRIGIILKDVRDGWMMWSPFVAILVAGTLAFWLRSEPAIRYIGLGLQLLGIWTIVADLLNKGKKYHLPNPLKRLARFLWQVIRPTHEVSAYARMNLEALTSDARADTWQNPVDTTVW